MRHDCKLKKSQRVWTDGQKLQKQMYQDSDALSKFSLLTIIVSGIFSSRTIKCLFACLVVSISNRNSAVYEM